MKIKKRIDNNLLKIILKAVMKKARIESIQLTHSDIEKYKDDEISIKAWKSGIFNNEIIDINYLSNEIKI